MFIASSVHCCAICCITVVASLYLKLVVDGIHHMYVQSYNMYVHVHLCEYE